MEVKVYTENGRVPVTVLHVDGNIDASTSKTFEEAANNAIAQGARHILVDLSHVRFISSVGLRALHYIFNQLRALETEIKLTDEEMNARIRAGTYKSPHLKLLNLSKDAETAFELAGFDMFLETHSEMKTAVASF